VWITADMHYTAAHYYDPNRAVFQDFDPFWEFVSGPLHAGTWGPGNLDNTLARRRSIKMVAVSNRART
jgi:alkaline phosphatase D